MSESEEFCEEGWGDCGVVGPELRAQNLAVAASVKKLCPYTLYKHRKLMCQETG